MINANSRIDNICLQQTNLVCNFGRQGLSAFCTILAARASAFLKRFVKHMSRQTLSADLSADSSAISKVGGGKVQGTLRRPRLCRQGLSANADKEMFA